METQIAEQTNGVKAPRKTKLLAVDPKAAEPSKPKILQFGKPGVGKTFFALDLPNVYYVDTEEGATRGHYTDKLKASGGAYFGPDQGSLDPKTLIEQVQALATEDHKYKTIVIDSISKLYNKLIAEESERLGEKDAFGASKKPAIAFMRRLLNWVDRIDMNVVLIAHEKDLWGPGNVGKVGETFDCWEKLEYELDLVLHIQKRGSSRVAVVRKSRLIGFPESDSFPLVYEEFAKRYGKEVIERVAHKIEIASEQQLEQINMLLEVVKVNEDEISKWFSRAKVENWSEMSSEQIEKCINFLKGKIK